jgi:hypothetical protein
MAGHGLPDVTVVADAGMISAANQKAIEDAGWSFILGARVPDVPYVVAEGRREHPDQDLPDAHVFVQPWPAGPAGRRRDQVVYYQHKTDRARRTHRRAGPTGQGGHASCQGATPAVAAPGSLST